MPAELFRTVATTSKPPGHRISAIPATLIAHAAVLAVIVVIPLLASDVLPLPPVRLHPVVEEIPVMPVVTVPQPPTGRRTGSTSFAGPGVPLEPPSGISENSVARGTERPAVAGDVGSDIGTDVLVGASAPVDDSTIVPPAPALGPPKPVRVGGNVRYPVKVHHEAPVYPSAAIAAKIEGMVVIEAVIGVGGEVQEARIINSVPLLDRAALEAVKHWRFTPTLLNGVPVAVVLTVQLDFKLR